MLADITPSIQMAMLGVMLIALSVEAPRRWPWTKWAYLVLLVAMVALLAVRLAGYDLRIAMPSWLYWASELTSAAILVIAVVLHLRAFLRGTSGDDLAEPR